tara:strand:+ start:281 stop:832 length:552 start_codon:yes stop_codon:yes gene_type:complete
MPVSINGNTGVITGLAALPDSAMASGSIVQVVSTTKTDAFTTTSSSLVDITGLNVSITPSSSSNKVLIIADVMGGVTGSTNVFGAKLQLVRGSTEIAKGDASGNKARGTVGMGASGGEIGNIQLHYGFHFLDSPATTSATTYKIQILQNQGTETRINMNLYDSADNANRVRSVSTITVMEVAA